MFELNFSLLDVWNRPEIRLLRWGTKKAVQGITTANTKSKIAEISTTEFAELLSEAQNGDSNAQCVLALYYAEKQDYEKFTDWLVKSAKQGNETALGIAKSLQEG
jgi:TPR repeat protein